MIGLPDMINNANIDDGMVRCTHECATSVSCTIFLESSLYSKIKRFMFLFFSKEFARNTDFRIISTNTTFPLSHFGCWLNSKHAHIWIMGSKYSSLPLIFICLWTCIFLHHSMVHTIFLFLLPFQELFGVAENTH